ncbi:MAG TPA: hypothetical protein VIS99_01605, partial [Terrimicrobiaceae bacterium]
LALSAAALPLFVYACFPALLIRLKRPQSWPRLCLPALLVVGSSLLLGSIMTPPNGFLWSDLAATLRFYTRSSLESSTSIGQVALNILRFFTQDGIHGLGVVALLLCCCRKFYAISLSGFLISFLLIQNRQNLSLFYYQAIVFLPLMMLAYGAAERRILEFARRRGARLQIVRGAETILLLAPILCAMSLAPKILTGSLIPRIHYWTTQSTNEVEQAARWLNDRTIRDDLVICHANLSWLLHARTADLQQATSWEGLPTWPFDVPLNKAQFRYKAGLEDAKFAVVGDIDMRWTLLQPNVEKLIEKMKRENWPIVWQGPNYLILENPHRHAEK